MHAGNLGHKRLQLGGYMKTVGKILKETREAKLYKLEDVERHTKIRKELLEALENDDYDKLPPLTFIQGFIKNYSKFLDLDDTKTLAIFRRDYEAKKHPPLIMESLANPINKKGFRITPPRILALFVTLIILVFFGYLWFEYRQFTGSPNLEVTTPLDQQSVEIPAIEIEGKTDPEVKVSVNNQEIGVDKEGRFKEEIKLSSSVNKITITATGKFGKSTTIERTVFVKKG